MSILKKKNLKSFLIYKLWLFILILAFLGTVFGHNMNTKMEVKQPELVYNDSKEFIESLNTCIDWIEKDRTKFQNIPRAIILAQAIIESDYGTSRFAMEGNNLFGVMTFNLDEPHLKPYKDENSKFGARVYPNKCESVKHYISVLNNSSAFENFRELRYKMIKEDNSSYIINDNFKYKKNYIKIS